MKCPVHLKYEILLIFYYESCANLMNIKNTLKHNCYSMHIVDKVIKKYFQENISEGNFHIIKKKILSKI